MDHHWVAKAWLSDVGLPQYSQAFHNHLVDGRMLNSLTRRDLERHLNITKKFHQVSLLLGIELLHLLSFDKEVSRSPHRTALNILVHPPVGGGNRSYQSNNRCSLKWFPGTAGSPDTVRAPERGSIGMDLSPGHQMDQRHRPEGGNGEENTHCANNLLSF